MFYTRQIQQSIEESLFQGKAIILYGARRVGKTTLSKQILDKYPSSGYINCELLQNKTILETTNSEQLKNYLGEYKLIVLDEAQQITNIGLTLKILTDTFPQIQVIATGSSSFDILNKTMEPLTGRSRMFGLYPLSLKEIKQQHDWLTISAKLENILRFGLYPEVFDKTSNQSIEELNNIASNYLYKDILQYERLKKPDLVYNILKAIAFQIGSEVSYNELSKLLGENIHTIKRYLELLEKTYIIFRLTSYSKNLRKEIGKGQKIYFTDLGIRNSIVQNFNPLGLRNDIGALWENFCILERLKHNSNNRNFTNYWFWRTYNQKEIDFIEEHSGSLHAFEFKYQNKQYSFPKDFSETYPNSHFEIINKENFMKLVE